jgi:hypothetical protein
MTDNLFYRGPGEFCPGSHESCTAGIDGRATCPYCSARRKPVKRKPWDGPSFPPTTSHANQTNERADNHESNFDRSGEADFYRSSNPGGDSIVEIQEMLKCKSFTSGARLIPLLGQV